MEARDRLWLHAHTSAKTAILVCGGWLDEHTCEQLHAALDENLEAGVERLRLDLTKLEGVDYAGINCLIATADRCQASGVGLEVEASGPLLNILREEGVVGVFSL
jgi:anti-anti-sigma regulatory factor